MWGSARRFQLLTAFFSIVAKSVVAWILVGAKFGRVAKLNGSPRFEAIAHWLNGGNEDPPSVPRRPVEVSKLLFC